MASKPPSPAAVTGPDARSLRLLNSCFMEKGQVRADSYKFFDPAPLHGNPDYEYAKARLVMFEPRLLTREQITDWARTGVAQLDPRIAADAFVASLETRALHRRMALGAYAIAHMLPAHICQPPPNMKYLCAVCGQHEPVDPNEPQDLNNTSFHRHRSGTFLGNIDRVALELEVFPAEPVDPPPTRAAWEMFARVLGAAADIGPKGTPGKLEKAIRGYFKANDLERRSVIELLGVLGILEDPAQPGFRQQWINWADREGPDGKNDWEYPVLWWRGSHGVNREALHEWFPHAPIALLSD